MKRIALDTEYGHNPETGMMLPFLATTTDEQLISKAYHIGTMGLYKKKSDDYCKIQDIAEDDRIIKVFHNASADISALMNIGMKPVPPYSDTMVAGGIVNENFSTKKLKPMAAKYLNEPCNEEKALSKAKNKITRELRKKGIIPPKQKGDKYFLPYYFIPPEILIPYALKDTEYTIKLEYLFMKTLEKYKDVYEFEMSLIPIVVDLYRNGMFIDRPFVAKMIEQYSSEQKKVLNKIIRMVKGYGLRFYDAKKKEVPFNPNSNLQISKVVEYLEIPITKFTTTGPATDKKTLEPFIDQYPFLEAHFDSEWYEKQLTTYYVPFYFHHTTDINSLAHFSYYQSAAKSGRFTAERIHQIPRKDEELEDPRVIRDCFPAPKGAYIVAIDYDQIEMRLFGHFSECKLLINAFLNGEDPYLDAARRIIKEVVSWETQLKIEKDVVKLAKLKSRVKGARRNLKIIMLGVIYGMGDGKMASSLGVSFMEGREILNSFYELYPVKPYMQSVISTLYKVGYIRVLYDSSLMHFYRDFRVPHDLAYKGVNMIMQGTAGYVMKSGMKRAYDWLQKKRVKTKPHTLNGTIHDELIFYIYENYKNTVEITQTLQEIMADRVTFSLPITATPKISDISWGAARGIK
jgi:DNA polymerase-1